MAEYIEKEAAIKKIREEGVRGDGYADSEREDDVVNMLEAIPAADVAPVVHGRWIECDYVKYDGHSECIHYPNEAWKCSICCNAFKKELLWKDNFCPNCGARMDGE